MDVIPVYSSSNTNVATVSASGKITTKGVGSAYIYAKTAVLTACYKINVVSLGNPVLVSATNASNGVSFVWKKVNYASGYVVYRKTGSGKWGKVATVKGTSYTDKSAKNGTKYTYIVLAYNGVVKSLFNTTGKTITVVAAPKITKCVKASTKSLKVTYSKNTKASGYEVAYSTKSSFSKSNTKTKTLSSKTVSKKFTGLTKGAKYYVRVRAYKTVSGKKVYSAWSAKKSVSLK